MCLTTIKRDHVMSEASIWWLVTGLILVAELSTGSFYLLMLGLGSLVAALSAHAGYSINIQLACAALVGGIGAVVLGQWKKHVLLAQNTEVSQHLDIGAVVLVEVWSEQKTTQVQHRGANWGALLSPGQVALPGSYRIIDVQGNHLILEKFIPQ